MRVCRRRSPRTSISGGAEAPPVRPSHRVSRVAGRAEARPLQRLPACVAAGARPLQRLPACVAAGASVLAAGRAAGCSLVKESPQVQASVRWPLSAIPALSGGATPPLGGVALCRLMPHRLRRNRPTGMSAPLIRKPMLPWQADGGLTVGAGVPYGAAGCHRCRGPGAAFGAGLLPTAPPARGGFLLIVRPAAETRPRLGAETNAWMCPDECGDANTNHRY